MALMLSKEKSMNEGIIRKNLDMSVSPTENFYDFATAGWRRDNPLEGEYSRFGAFDKLGLAVLEQVRDLILEIAEKKHAPGSIGEKIKTIYAQAMDYDKRNADGTLPVRADLAAVDGIKSMAEYLGAAHRTGNPFWRDGVDIDAKDSDAHIFGIGQSGIGLARDYLLDIDAKSRETRKKYQKYMADVFKIFGISDAPASKVYEMELEMAKGFYPKEKLRDPHANYHKFSYGEFKKKFKGFDWDAYFKARGAAPKFIDVGQPEALEKSLGLLRTKDARVIRAYLKWNVANGAMNLLGDAEYDLAFDFYDKTLSGKLERRPKWKDATVLVESVLGEAVGKMYVEKYFPESAKKRMLALVENLRRAYADRIRNLDWMGADTKEKALEKLAAFRVKIGYPDKWRDLSKLEIIGDSLYADIRRASRFEDDFWLEKLAAGEKVDKDMWYINAQTVNAYYYASLNEICFPAGILQPPFFDMNADDAFNYGAIGSVIGHEMTHGFDDEGRHFDKDGNMKDWWSASDAAAFKKRAEVMRKFFDKIQVLPGVHANGEFTLGENLADYGGLIIAFDAYKKYGRPAKEGDFAPEQRFFIAYAGCETVNIRDEEIVKRTKTDPHSMSEWRVNGILPHVDAWNDAFGAREGRKMFVPASKRCRLW